MGRTKRTVLLWARAYPNIYFEITYLFPLQIAYCACKHFLRTFDSLESDRALNDRGQFLWVVPKLMLGGDFEGNGVGIR